MGVYTIRKCPHCKKMLEFKYGNDQYFGDPLIKCSKCGGNVILDNITEWEIMSKWEQFTLLFWSLTWGNLIIIFGSFFLSFIGLMIILAIFKSSISEYSHSYTIIILIGSIASLIKVSLNIKGIINMINESKERTKDEKYLRYISNLKRR